MIKRRNKMNRITKFIILFAIFIGTLNLTFADPSNPPEPPAVESYIYYLMDEFKGCGPLDQMANYCDAYYSRQKGVTQGGTVNKSPVVYVCGIDPRCNASEPCLIDDPINSTGGVIIPLDEFWYCPDGYGIAVQHPAANDLDPGFDGVSFSRPSAIDTNYIGFFGGTQVNVFFNAFIPACVNRIPMMNFKSELIPYTNDSTKYSEKTGLYAKHETVDYDYNPMGGYLETFEIPEFGEFRKVLRYKGDLSAYRMWSFRERFVEALQRVVNDTTKNLTLPEDIDVDSLASNQAHHIKDLYLSRDFMLGSYSVEIKNNSPSGTSLIQEINSTCSFDVHELNIVSIKKANDLDNALKSPGQKAQIVEVLTKKPSICNLDNNINITNIAYLEELDSWDSNMTTESLGIIYLDVVSVSGLNNVMEFITWANSNLAFFSNDLRNKNYLQSDPRQEITAINGYTFTSQSYDVLVDTSMINGVSTGAELKTYIDGLNPSDYDEFSKTLTDNSVLDKGYLIENIASSTIDAGNSVRITGNLFTTDILLNINIETVSRYHGFALISLQLDYQTTTTQSWNWRSLESLTLTQMAKCLYNWDACLLNQRRQSSIYWPMYEIADLGYGPMYNSVAYQWSKSTVDADYPGYNYSIYFDGARGKEYEIIPMIVYKKCEENQTWISDEKYYACRDGFVYKCHYGLSLDEIELDFVKSAEIGQTLMLDDGIGYVCTNTNSEGPIWRRISC